MKMTLLQNFADREFIIPRIVNWLGKASVGTVVVLSAILLAIITLTIGFMKGSTGIIGSVAPFYLLPIGIVALRANRSAGVVTGLLCSFVWTILDFRYAGNISYWPEAWNVLIRAGIFVMFALALARIKYDILKEMQLNGELQAAIAEVKKLSGLLPICAWCKRIRDDDGNWESVETYITVHSEADFTHGICPDCAKRYHQAPQQK